MATSDDSGRDGHAVIAAGASSLPSAPARRREVPVGGRLAMRGDHDGDLVVHQQARAAVDGTVRGSLTASAGARVAIRGDLTGDLTAEEGSRVVVNGSVGGNVVDRGGRVVVSGRTGAARPQARVPASVQAGGAAPDPAAAAHELPVRPSHRTACRRRMLLAGIVLATAAGALWLRSR